jgi:hypothetical protein
LTPLKGYLYKYEAVSASYISPLCFLNNIHVKLAIHFSLEEKIVKKYLYLSKLAAQMVTSTPSENRSLHLYESKDKIYNFGTLKTLILHVHARSIFFKGGHPTKIWRKKIFFMKTLSKLGALTVPKKQWCGSVKFWYGSGSVSLTLGSGSCSFCQWLSRSQQNISFLKVIQKSQNSKN